MSIAQFQIKVQRNLLILAVGLFALSAVDYAEDGRTVLSTVLTCASVLNLLAFFMSQYFGSYAGALFNLANAIVALVVTLDLFNQQRKYQPYIWLFVALLYIVATIVALIKTVRSKD